jgi:hypothetical protein
MALAKYLEDITDRWFEDLAATGRLEATFVPGTYEPAPSPPTSWIRLNLKNSPLPDRIALLSGDEPCFEVTTDSPNALFQAAFVSGPESKLPTVLLSGRTLSFKLLKAGLYRLQLICGSYRQDYEIDVTETLDLDRQDTIQQGYLALQDRPDEWTRDRFDSLKKRMSPANRPAGIPSTFCNGILDYHLALYHSEQGKAEIANSRFVDAYRNLRPYIAHSDVARFVCDYIHYLMNRFEGCTGTTSKGKFGGLRAFLSSPFEDSLRDRGRSPARNPSRYVEVLVLSLDQKLIEVVNLIQVDGENYLPQALESLENHYLTTNPNPCSKARILFILARGNRRLEQIRKAKSFYQQLTQANAADQWHQEARDY